MSSDHDIKVIVDTNLWISWLITKDYKKLDKILISNKARLVFSKELFQEFIEVAHRPKLKKYFSKRDLDNLVILIDEFAFFTDVKTIARECRDEKDNFLLALAIDSKADLLITGDKDLLELKKVQETRIITIADFLKEI
jgi:putative PIN family toxin of toxin-antitoxin system